VTCTPNGPTQTVNLTSATPSVTLPNIMAGSVCTLLELPPIGPIPSNCQWGPAAYPIGQNATIPAQGTIERTVENRLICSGPNLAPVTLLKTITNMLPGTVPPTIPFPVTVTCQPGATVVTVTLSPNTPQTLSLPVGTSCTFVEAPLPPVTPMVNCAAIPGPTRKWGPPTYPLGQTIAINQPGPVQNVEVHNTFGCFP
jgi:hypothetical protein